MKEQLKKIREYLPNKKQIIIPALFLIIIILVFAIILIRTNSKINQTNLELKKINEEKKTLSSQISEKDSQIKTLEEKVNDASVWFQLNDSEKSKIKQDLENRKKVESEKKSKEEEKRKEEEKKKEIKEYADIFFKKADKVTNHANKYFSLMKNMNDVDPSKGREIMSEVNELALLGGELNLYTNVEELKEVNELANNAGEDLIEASNKHDDAISSTGSDEDLQEGYNLILKSLSDLESANKKLRIVLNKYGIQ